MRKADDSLLPLEFVKRQKLTVRVNSLAATMLLSGTEVLQAHRETWNIDRYCLLPKHFCATQIRDVSFPVPFPSSSSHHTYH